MNKYKYININMYLSIQYIYVYINIHHVEGALLSSPPYRALCTKYRALIAEMQKRKRPILCYSEFRAKALIRQTIT